jgi:hypothetical protein
MKRGPAQSRGIQPTASYPDGISALVRLLAQQAAKEILAGSQDQNEGPAQ